MQASAPRASDSLAVPVLATVALRRGDLAAAAEYGQRLSAVGRYYGSPIWLTGSAWWRPRSWRPGAAAGGERRAHGSRDEPARHQALHPHASDVARRTPESGHRGCRRPRRRRSSRPRQRTLPGCVM
jgi:hypothetical protein